MFEQDSGEIGNIEQAGGNRDSILNQQWKEPPYLQPPMIPTATPVPQHNSHDRPQTQTQGITANPMSATDQQVEPQHRRQENLQSEPRTLGPTPTSREK